MTSSIMNQMKHLLILTTARQNKPKEGKTNTHTHTTNFGTDIPTKHNNHAELPHY